MFFEREDWKLFRNMDTLPKSKLSMLVCKELADNALDTCGSCEIGYEGGFFYVKDRGPGLDPKISLYVLEKSNDIRDPVRNLNIRTLNQIFKGGRKVNMVKPGENGLSELLQDNVSLRLIEPHIYTVYQNTEVANSYDTGFGNIYDWVACK